MMYSTKFLIILQLQSVASSVVPFDFDCDKASEDQDKQSDFTKECHHEPPKLTCHNFVKI